MITASPFRLRGRAQPQGQQNPSLHVQIAVHGAAGHAGA